MKGLLALAAIVATLTVGIFAARAASTRISNRAFAERQALASDVVKFLPIRSALLASLEPEARNYAADLMTAYKSKPELEKMVAPFLATPDGEVRLKAIWADEFQKGMKSRLPIFESSVAKFYADSLSASQLKAMIGCLPMRTCGSLPFRAPPIVELLKAVGEAQGRIAGDAAEDSGLARARLEIAPDVEVKTK